MLAPSMAHADGKLPVKNAVSTTNARTMPGRPSLMIAESKSGCGPGVAYA